MKKESWAGDERIRRIMQGNRSRDTRPEMAVRKILHSKGLRYRVDIRPEPKIPRKADIVFPRLHVAVFIDGCYWHGCPQHYVQSKTNTEYWIQKIANNSRRDGETNKLLTSKGWIVLRFWSHQPPQEIAAVVQMVAKAADRSADPA